jgi:carboxymethylenebutenolidase
MCFDDDSHPPIDVADPVDIHALEVRLTSEDGAEPLAYFAEPEGYSDGQVVILPDVRGLHGFYRELCERFAESGVRALALDYFSRTAESDTRDDSFDYAPHVGAMTPETFEMDLRAAAAYLRQGEQSAMPTFTVGFCMGGSLSFYAATLGLQFTGVVGFYAGLTRTRGAVTPAVDFGERIASPLLGLFGGADEGIPVEDIDRFDEALDRAGVLHELVIYPGAPHSFFDRKAGEFAEASADAWRKVQTFIAEQGTVKV